MEHNFESVFSFKSHKGILKSQHLGIAGNRASVRTPFESVTALEALQVCPYANSGFRSEVKIGGESIKGEEYTWRINLLERTGSADRFDIKCLTVIPPNKNAVIQKISIYNKSAETVNIPLELWYQGNTQYVKDWLFEVPGVIKGKEEPEKTAFQDNRLILSNEDATACIITGSLQMRLFQNAGILMGRAEIPAGETYTVYVSFHAGELWEVEEESRQISSDYGKYMEEAFSWVEEEERRLFQALPFFACQDKAYEKFYYRSLVTLILNRWESPDFKFSPYYSTGGIGGGCMCNYLWDYGAPCKLHPMVDRNATKEEIKAFLAVDLSKCFAIKPVDGGAYGPWYMVNQEKIIGLIYYYLANTGDFAFLDERAGDRTVIEWVRFHACFGDEGAAEGKLVDYGMMGEHHLELRNGIAYHGVMPDLNMRRYLTYQRASEILACYGSPDENMMKRAEKLRFLVKKELWDADKRWFRFRMKEEGMTDYPEKFYQFMVKEGLFIKDKKHFRFRQEDDLRYTVQMFKFLDSPAADEEIRSGLISHLNEEEFLSDFGLHSMSKLDEAYDQVDIDNGGGGICAIFVPVILEQLYNIGECEKANDIFRRVLWWGERVPYWGDSFTANAIAYREDTPLMATTGSAVGAQMMIFGIFGIKADFDGTITVNPVKRPPAEQMRLVDVKLRGKVFSVSLDRDGYTVECEKKKWKCLYGQEVKIECHDRTVR